MSFEHKRLPDGSWRADFDGQWYAVAVLRHFDTEPSSLWIATNHEILPDGSTSAIGGPTGATARAALLSAETMWRDTVWRRAALVGRPTLAEILAMPVEVEEPDEPDELSALRDYFRANEAVIREKNLHFANPMSSYSGVCEALDRLDLARAAVKKVVGR